MSYERDRSKLVKRLKRHGYIESEEVEQAMSEVPRHLFVPENVRSRAYVDSPQPIGQGQTISAPHMVAMMVENLDLKKGQKVLEVGGGRGYHAAVIAEIVGKEGKVITMELLKSLADEAENVLKAAGYEHVDVVAGDGSSGYQKEAPYDRISVACGAPDIPPPLLDQLKVGGKMLIPVGGSFYQNLILAVKTDKNKIKKKDLGGVLFVPLKGEYGY
ncbi:MAG: protein-L-isoaspartate O-methyltransferase [Candidatus Saliniplasma sp.]